MSQRIKTYTELSSIETFEERYRYLRLHASIGMATFGFDRYLNQQFYTSVQWRHARHAVIARDRGCDLGLEGYEIFDRPTIHHMNPVRVEDLTSGLEDIFDPEYLITVSHRTHNAIHYGDEKLLTKPLIARRPGDTKLW